MQETNRLSIGISPCPNDTFMFEALINKRVDTEGLVFDPVMEDVESLNNRSFREELDVSKLSFHALAFVLDKYSLLNAGSALGHKCGPLLIAKEPLSGEEIRKMKVAIPGRYTTANFLFSLYAPECRNKEEMNFSAIEEAVLSGEADAGVIIHENRFTYQQKGLFRVADLGEFWEEQTGKPIPLGGIAVKRSHSQEVKEKVDRVIRRSIEYAFSNPEAGRSFVRQHAQEMEEEVMYRHIELYVNKYSLELGKDGREAVRCLFRKAAELKVIPCPGEIFIN